MFATPFSPFPPLTSLQSRPPRASQVAPEDRLPSTQEARLKLKQLSDERAAKWPNTLEARWLLQPARRPAASGLSVQRVLHLILLPSGPATGPGIRG